MQGSVIGNSGSRTRNPVIGFVVLHQIRDQAEIQNPGEWNTETKDKDYSGLWDWYCESRNRNPEEWGVKSKDLSDYSHGANHMTLIYLKALGSRRYFRK